MSGAPSAKRIRGRGFSVRHSRSCLLMKGGDHCTCEPSYRGFVYVAGKGVKRRTFHTAREARHWRREELRRIYANEALRTGRVDTGYSLLRRAIAEVDGALAGSATRDRVALRSVLDSLYVAEDQLLVLLTRLADS